MPQSSNNKKTRPPTQKDTSVSAVQKKRRVTPEDSLLSPSSSYIHVRNTLYTHWARPSHTHTALRRPSHMQTAARPSHIHTAARQSHTHTALRKVVICTLHWAKPSRMHTAARPRHMHRARPSHMHTAVRPSHMHTALSKAESYAHWWRGLPAESHFMPRWPSARTPL